MQALQPDLVLVSASQDAAAWDPIGRMSLTTEGFRAITQRVRQAADQICHGRLIAVQEGGYSLHHLPFCVLAIVEELARLPPQFATDPTDPDGPGALRSWEAAAVDSVASELGLP